MTHAETVSRWLAGRRWGVEIGAFKTPIPGLSPFYVDCFEEYAGERCLLDFKGDACHLPFVDNSLDYVATSHVLEHVANPLQAFLEWGRVLRPDGIVYSVIPDKRFTWDRHRATTQVEHLIEDFQRHTTQKDGTHVDDFIDGIVWEEYAPGKSVAEKEAYRHLLRESTKANLEINIHFHVFEPAYFPILVEGINRSGLLPVQLDLLAVEERFPTETPNGFLTVLQVRKAGWAHRVAGALNRLRGSANEDGLIKPRTKRYPRGRTGPSQGA